MGTGYWVLVAQGRGEIISFQGRTRLILSGFVKFTQRQRAKANARLDGVARGMGQVGQLPLTARGRALSDQFDHARRVEQPTACRYYCISH